MRGLRFRRWRWMLAATAAVLIAFVVMRPAFSWAQAMLYAWDAAAAPSIAVGSLTERNSSGHQPAQPNTRQDLQTRSTPAPATPSSDNCIACHTNKQVLQQLAQPDPVVASAMNTAETVAGAPAAVEAWQRVYVDPAFISDDIHSQPGCIGCHGGVSGFINMADAHNGMVARPGARPAQLCGGCHVGIVKDARTSVHRMLPDFVAALKARGADFTMPETVNAFNAQCAQCHATCGDCHISRPSVAGGGLVAGHIIQDAAPQSETCTACHNTTVNAEFSGAHAGIEGDVHAAAGMACTDCHSAKTMHQSQRAASQNGGAACIDCHQDDVKVSGDNVQHMVHVNTVQCQVCHSAGAYTSCFTCHTGEDEEGLPYATTDLSALTFKIGRNPSPDAQQPWNYVLVRHAPADPDLWAFYGDDLLPDFDNAPTWHTTAPHNIQKNTPQNATCNSCHGQRDLFLTEDDVAPETLDANSGVIVPRVPPARVEVAP